MGSMPHCPGAMRRLVNIIIELVVVKTKSRVLQSKLLI